MGKAKRGQSLPAMGADITRRIALVAIVMAAALAAAYFPRATDAPLTRVEQDELRRHFTASYQAPKGAEEDSQAEDGSEAFRVAGKEVDRLGVRASVESFARSFGLAGGKVLDIGAGRGYLQDVVADYTGLDISPSARRFFHKKFVVGSATGMPFSDSEFDAAWTIFVLEHILNPEAALAEMRRVLKDGGVLLLAPAWDCTPWAAEGLPVRPYGDFGWSGRVKKASIPFQVAAGNLAKLPIRLIRYGHWKAAGGPAALRYHRLAPNYKRYWMPDSDAVNSLDRHETALWFLSRGDECLNCDGALHGWVQQNEPLIIRIRKVPAGRETDLSTAGTASRTKNN